MYLFAIAGMTLFVANISGLIVAILICTKHRSKYYTCIWSVMALANGILGTWLIPQVMPQGWEVLIMPGTLFGVFGLLTWAIARRHPRAK
jgi:hypothetical protein